MCFSTTTIHQPSSESLSVSTGLDTPTIHIHLETSRRNKIPDVERVRVTHVVPTSSAISTCDHSAHSAPATPSKWPLQHQHHPPPVLPLPPPPLPHHILPSIPQATIANTGPPPSATLATTSPTPVILLPLPIRPSSPPPRPTPLTLNTLPTPLAAVQSLHTCTTPYGAPPVPLLHIHPRNTPPAPAVFDDSPHIAPPHLLLLHPKTHRALMAIPMISYPPLFPAPAAPSVASHSLCPPSTSYAHSTGKS